MSVNGVNFGRINAGVGNRAADTPLHAFRIRRSHGTAHSLAAAINMAADYFRVDSGSSGLSGFQIFQNHYPSSGTGNKAAGGSAQGAGTSSRVIVKFAAKHAHGVKTCPDVRRRA